MEHLWPVTSAIAGLISAIALATILKFVEARLLLTFRKYLPIGKFNLKKLFEFMPTVGEGAAERCSLKYYHGKKTMI